MVSTILPFLSVVVASNEEILPRSMKVLVEHRLSMPRNKESYPVFLTSKESLAQFSYLGNPVGLDKLLPNSAKQRRRVKTVFFIIINVVWLWFDVCNWFNCIIFWSFFYIIHYQEVWMKQRVARPLFVQDTWRVVRLLNFNRAKTQQTFHS